MRAAWLLVLVAGCEMEVPPSKAAPTPPPPRIARITANPASQVQRLDVIVREYGTETPIGNATIDLQQFRACPPDTSAQVCPPARTSARTDGDGAAHLVLTFPEWNIARISAPGYLTACPALSDDEWRHRLVVDSTKQPVGDSLPSQDEPAKYICYLVPPSALVVHDPARATRLAKAVPEVAEWLRHHRDARTVQVELVGIRWEVRLETPSKDPDVEYGEARLIVVDGLEPQNVYVEGRWE